MNDVRYHCPDYNTLAQPVDILEEGMQSHKIVFRPRNNTQDHTRLMRWHILLGYW